MKCCALEDIQKDNHGESTWVVLHHKSSWWANGVISAFTLMISVSSSQSYIALMSHLYRGEDPTHSQKPMEEETALDKREKKST
ncbi:hypothetical protein HPG69_010735 [Diceros bicornis minor]|uniref:Uncharacterized protein n=1 Tax=Diceros bicornis minor TaxID=77932 RepID=A0A7J7EU44_DICBM|nr:hypothetical protein HPG69_010735 [Diceros bicornis minor]